MRAALHRAAHQLLDRPPIFEDPLALRIVGDEAVKVLEADSENQQRPMIRALRASLAARSRYTEDALTASLARGVGQYVVLGAGLDTFAYRNAHPSLRVFELDHPATQAWKRERLAAAHIAVPPSLTFVPVDFEKQTLAEGLSRAGLDPAVPTFFCWLGVTTYLTKSAVMDTLRFVAERGAGTEIVCDFLVTRESLQGRECAMFDRLAEVVASTGEPFLTLLEPAEFERETRALGFGQVDVVGPSVLAPRYFAGRIDGLHVTGLSRLLQARV